MTAANLLAETSTSGDAANPAIAAAGTLPGTVPVEQTGAALVAFVAIGCSGGRSGAVTAGLYARQGGLIGLVAPDAACRGNVQSGPQESIHRIAAPRIGERSQAAGHGSLQIYGQSCGLGWSAAGLRGRAAV